MYNVRETKNVKKKKKFKQLCSIHKYDYHECVVKSVSRFFLRTYANNNNNKNRMIKYINWRARERAEKNAYVHRTYGGGAVGIVSKGVYACITRGQQRSWAIRTVDKGKETKHGCRCLQAQERYRPRYYYYYYFTVRCIALHRLHTGGDDDETAVPVCALVYRTTYWSRVPRNSIYRRNTHTHTHTTAVRRPRDTIHGML